jgi:hypothetical protein
MKIVACTGECELASGALQQPCTEVCFELLDAATHGIGRHAQAPCRLGKAAAANYLHKHRDVIEVEHGRSFLALMDECNPIVSTNQVIGLALLFQALGREAFHFE